MVKSNPTGNQVKSIVQEFSTTIVTVFPEYRRLMKYIETCVIFSKHMFVWILLRLRVKFNGSCTKWMTTHDSLPKPLSFYFNIFQESGLDVDTRAYFTAGTSVNVVDFRGKRPLQIILPVVYLTLWFIPFKLDGYR